MAKTLDWLKAHYDRVALIAAGIFLFIAAISILWNAIQFGNRLVAQPGSPPKNASPPPVATELDRAAERLQHPLQWKSSTRSGLFVPEKHFIGANGLPATLQNTQVHAPVPNDWFEKFGLPIQDADVLEQDPDTDGFTNLDEWQGGTDPTNKDSHPDYLTKLHLVSATEEPFRFIFSSWVGRTFALNTIDQSERTQGYPRAGDSGEGKGRYLAAIRGHFRLYMGRTSGVRSEKRPRIFLETRRRDQLQARGCAAEQSRNREYAETKCADRDRFCAALRSQRAKSQSGSL